MRSSPHGQAVERTCVVCRRKLPQKQLVRVARGPDGITIDESGKGPGRGAYLCRWRTCWTAPTRDRRLGAGLRTRVSSAESGQLDAWAHAHSEELPEQQPADSSLTKVE